jgi:hypothetical protein
MLFIAEAVNNDVPSNDVFIMSGVQGRIRSQGTENAEPSMIAQLLIHRNSSNNFQDCNTIDQSDSEPSSSRAIALYTPFFANGSTSSDNNVAGNSVPSETSFLPMIRPPAQPCSSSIGNQAESLPQEEPLPVGWEMRHDVYGRR